MEPNLLRACTTGGGLLQGGAGREQECCSHGDTLHSPVREAEPGARRWRRGPALTARGHPAKLLEAFERSKRPGRDRNRGVVSGARSLPLYVVTCLEAILLGCRLAGN